MSRIKTVIFAIATAVMVLPAFSLSQTANLVKNRSAASAAVKPGVWHAGFKKCKDYATKNKVPLIAVWSNGDACGHCVGFESSCNSTYFKNWMKTSGCVFYFIYSGDKGDGAVGSDVFHWIRNNKNTAYPFVRIYWPAGKVDVATVGDTVDGNKDGTSGGKKAVAYFKSKLKNFKPTKPVVKPKYTGGSFDAGDTEDNRLEAEVGNTTSVNVSLSRTNTVVSTVSTNKVVVIYPDGTTVTNTIKWTSGTSGTNLTVDVSSSLTTPGQQISLILLDAANKAIATNHVTMVTEPANSPKNPRWIGERDADTLAWGEWTMDLDVATNKVAAYNKANGASLTSARLMAAPSPSKAYTLLLIGGPLWCPDCVRAEEYLINTPEFRNWATNENRIACVAIDEPKFGRGYTDRPTLLTPYALSTSLSATSASGASYLSRKMAAPELAARILERNLDFVNKDTRNGGYCTPDNTADAGNTGVWRTGIPCIIVLREDGSVAGRLFQFSNSTAALEDGTAGAAAMVQRLREIVAQDADVNEELNDSWHTTTEKLDLQETIEDRTLSFSDIADIYRLDPEKTLNQRVKVTISPVAGKADFLAGTRLEAKIIQASGSSTKMLASTVAGLADDGGIECVAEVASTSSYLVVSYPMDANAYALDPQFALGNTGSMLCHYMIKTDFVAVPTESNKQVTVSGDLAMALVSNTVYRLVGIDAEQNAGVLQPVEGKADCYVALTTDDVDLKLAQADVEYQIWNPGTVGFTRTSASVSEPKTASSATLCTIALARKGGSSGKAVVNVVLDEEKSSSLEGLYELGEEFNSALTWEEGDVSTKTVTLKVLDNPFADGDQVLYFKIVRAGDCDAEEGVAEFRLTLCDNDKEVPGRLAVVETEPAMASAMTVFQRAGDSVTVGVGRVDGTTGELAGSLSTTQGTLSETAFSWPGRETATRTSELTLADDAAGKKIVVTLTPVAGTKVDSARRKLTVNVLDADVPGFVEESHLLSAQRYLPIPDLMIALDDKAQDTAKIKKHSGALPPGLGWRQDGKNLVLSGVPTKAGSFTAAFRAYNGSTAGLTVAVTVDVSDPVLTGGGAMGEEPLNPSVAVTRTFADVPVYDATTNRLVGLLTLTLPRTGRASAKYRKVGGTVTLSCANWSAIDAAGALTAELQDKTGAYALSVVAAADGTAVATLTDPDFADGVVCEVLEKVWSASKSALDFKGYYTVSLPRKETLSGIVFAAGAGYATLKMNTTTAIRAGLFTYAGVYPNGKPFSGTATLTPKNWNSEFGYYEYAVLPLFAPGTADTLAGAVKFTPGAYDTKAGDVDSTGQFCEGRCSYQNIRRSVHPAAEAALVWSHAEKADAATCEVLLDAYGTYYLSTESFASCCSSSLKTTKLKFFALAGINAVTEEDLEDLGIDLRHGFADWTVSKSLTGVNVSYAKLTSKAKTKTNQIVSTDTKKLSFKFTLSTGIVSGSFKMPFGGTSVAMTFQGVVMPGWGSADCTDCGMGGVEATQRPFISGTAWFNDTLDYVDAKGRDRTVTIRRSCPFSVGVNAGE